jgi:alkanesulfonate monooxygenase SsuD/methylene tetrahydromethanopterin reductase-like flavin-dependent oxidoreductase (luciferase family)
MLALTGELADGLFLSFVGPTGVPALVEATQEAALRHQGRTAEVGHRILVPFPGEDGRALDRARDLLVAYSRVDIDKAMFERVGSAAETDRVAALARRGDREGARRAVSDDLLAEFFVVGTPEEQYRRLGDYVRGGVTLPLLAFFPPPDDPTSQHEYVSEALAWFGTRWRADRERVVHPAGSVPGGGDHDDHRR